MLLTRNQTVIIEIRWFRRPRAPSSIILYSSNELLFFYSDNSIIKCIRGTCVLTEIFFQGRVYGLRIIFVFINFSVFTLYF